MEIITIFSIAILIMSVVIHELAHGYAALWMGDPTAKYACRLTMNPIKHLDWFGSVIVPLVMAILPGNFILGWAKPVPYNPYNLKNLRWGELVVAIAGPISNLVLALIFGIFFRYGVSFGFEESIMQITLYVVVINVALAIFNLFPVPPLDGSKILFALLPPRMLYIREFLEKNALIFIIIFIFFVWQILSPIIFWIVELLTGLGA